MFVRCFLFCIHVPGYHSYPVQYLPSSGHDCFSLTRQFPIESLQWSSELLIYWHLSPPLMKFSSSFGIDIMSQSDKHFRAQMRGETKGSRMKTQIQANINSRVSGRDLNIRRKTRDNPMQIIGKVWEPVTAVHSTR